MHQSLYRKYRPTNFDEVAGQKVIIKTLKNAIKNNTLSHAYLFAGPRGTGKTSIAKILAKIVNCEKLDNYNPCNNCVNCTQYNNNQAVDIIEIDAATNNGVNEIRELKSKIGLVPALGKYKVYIIDEVHMLSDGAFNALLKTLEEPPEHVIFVLATTDPHKIPLTILSRCQRFDFKKLDLNQIIDRLNYVVKEENINIDEDALKEIAYLSDGGMRDSLSLLDQAQSYADDKITIQDIHEINGTITNKELNDFLNNIINNNIEDIFKKIDKFNSDGKDFYKLTEEIINHLRNILIYKNVPNYFEENSNYDVDISFEQVMKYIKIFNETIYEMKTSISTKLLFELAIIQLMKNDNKKINNDELLEKLKKIRINNTLCNFNKKEFLQFKNDIKSIKINDKEYEKLIDLGIIKAYSNDYFIILYEDSELLEKFNNNYKTIDKILLNSYNKPLRGIAVDNASWKKIKKEFNNKEKTYEYIDEEKEIR